MTTAKPRSEITDYGFVFGAANVQRITNHHGTVYIEVATPRERMILRVTPSGLIRVQDHSKVSACLT